MSLNITPEEFLSLIDLDHLAPFLISEKILPHHDLEDIYQKETDFGKKHELLQRLIKNQGEFEKFIKVLEISGHAQAVDSVKREGLQAFTVRCEDAQSEPCHNIQPLRKTRSHNPSEGKLYKLTVKPGTELKTGPRIYKMTSKPRGLCLLINNVNFKNEKREGSDRDAERLEMVFKDFDFEVVPKPNLEGEEMRKELEEFAKRSEHWIYDSCVVIILTHGLNNILYGIDDHPVFISEIKDFFNNRNCRALKGKPKMFFIQACRGRDHDYGVPKLGDEADARIISNEKSNEAALKAETKTNEKIPTLTDMLISYSTVEGKIAIRNTILGAWYCQQLVRVLMEKACDWELREMLDEVDEKVQEYESVDARKQATSYETIGWNKKLYFNPKISIPLLPSRIYRLVTRMLRCALPYILVALFAIVCFLILLLWYTEPISGMMSKILL